MAEIAERVGLTGVQLHGDEPAEQLADVSPSGAGRRKLIKTLQARELLADAGGQALQGYLDSRGKS